MVIYLLFLSLLTSCSPDATPWDHKVKDETINLKSLERIKSQSFGPTLRIGLIADPQGRPDDLYDTVPYLNRLNLDMVFLAGDVTDHSLKHEYESAFKALERITPPLFVVPGNHDAIAFGKELFQQLFGPLEMDLEVNGWKFVLWNNNQFEFGETDFGAFADRLNEKSIIISHIPPSIDAHKEAQFKKWEEIYQTKNPRLSLHGHLHNDSVYRFGDVPVFVANSNHYIHYHYLLLSESSLEIYLCHKDKCGKFYHE